MAASAPRTPGLPRGRGHAPRGALGRRPRAAALTDTHAAWPTVLAGRRRGRAVLHLPDAATHDHHRPAQVRLGRRGPRRGPPLAGAGGARPGGRRRRRRGRQRRAPGPRPARPRRSSPGPRAAGRRRSATTRPGCSAGAKAILRVDDRPTEVPLPEIPPRQAAQVPLTVRFPAQGPHDISLQLPEDELAGRQPALGGGPRQGLAADPPGRRRALVGAVRLGGRLPRRAPLDRRRRRRGLARRGRPGGELPQPRGSSPPTSSSSPTSRRRPHEQAAEAGRARPRRDGADDLHRGEAGHRPVQRAALPIGRAAPAVPAQGAGRRGDPGPDRRARPAVADREAAGAEALGAGARAGPPVHGAWTSRPASRARSGCWPAGTTRRGRPR